MNICETDSELSYLSSATLKVFFALKCRFKKTINQRLCISTLRKGKPLFDCYEKI